VLDPHVDVSGNLIAVLVFIGLHLGMERGTELELPQEGAIAEEEQIVDEGVEIRRRGPPTTYRRRRCAGRSWTSRDRARSGRLLRRSPPPFTAAVGLSLLSSRPGGIPSNWRWAPVLRKGKPMRCQRIARKWRGI
jgi:hypothetical protein